MKSKAIKTRLQCAYEEASSMGFGSAISNPNDSMIDAIVTSFKLKGLILDVGCGVGYDCYSFYTHGLKPIGLDSNPSLLRIARKHLGDLDYLVGDAQRLPFRFEVFDAIFSKGLSIFSTTDEDLCRSFIEDTLIHLRKNHPFVIILSTDLSGKARKSTWINHNLKDIKLWRKNVMAKYFFVYNIWKIPIVKDVVKLVPVFNDLITNFFVLVNKIYRRKGYLFAVLQHNFTSPATPSVDSSNTIQYNQEDAVLYNEGQIIEANQ